MFLFPIFFSSVADLPAHGSSSGPKGRRVAAILLQLLRAKVDDVVGSLKAMDTLAKKQQLAGFGRDSLALPKLGTAVLHPDAKAPAPLQTAR